MIYKKIHFVGVKGVGMTSLAILVKEAGCTVTGCDIDEQFITDEPLERADIIPLKGFSKEHLKNIDLVITTGAHGGLENPEVKAAKEIGIPVWTQGEALGRAIRGAFGKRAFQGISVAGSHGKTTTTAMIATLLSHNDLDPSYCIGTSTIPSLPFPGHFGKGDYFVAEADEYAIDPVHDKTPKFLWQHPKIAVFTNLELDHPDVYASLEQVQDAFLAFAHQILPNGVLIYCGDDKRLEQLGERYMGKKITYGYTKNNDYILFNIQVTPKTVSFSVKNEDRLLGEFSLQIAGKHNALNALAAIIVGKELGLTTRQIQMALEQFQGSKRRLEYLGALPTGALLYDDYAHHPTEIATTLTALKDMYPDKKIICVFQPHTYSRTQKMFDKFLGSFSAADTVILTKIYASLREEATNAVSSSLLYEAMKQTHNDVLVYSEPLDVVQYIRQKAYKNDSVIVLMGAGDVYKLQDMLL